MVVVNIKKAKETKKCVMRRESKFKNYKDSLLSNKIILKSLPRFKSMHIMYILNKLIRLHRVVMMIKVFKLLIKLEHIHMEQMILKYVKVRY